jgi:hypothetical protein
MTPVRGPRGKVVHVSFDLKRSLCGRKVSGWIIEPDACITCLTCHTASTTN